MTGFVDGANAAIASRLCAPYFEKEFFRVPESPVSVFDELIDAEPPVNAPILFDTVCVLGGSVAGLLAARVLSDHARRVVIIERDEFPAQGLSRPGTPQDQQVHTLLPAGFLWMERWLPGLIEEAVAMGAVLSEGFMVVDGHPQPRSEVGEPRLLLATRPFLEARIRSWIADLPNISFVRGLARGLRYRGGAVSAVNYVAGEAAEVLDTDFVVDAMGRSSRMPDWVAGQGYDKPRTERLEFPINYATARFERTVAPEDLQAPGALSIYTPGHAVDGVSVAAVNAVEGGQWIVMLVGFGEDRPGRTIEAFRQTCAKLLPLYGQAASSEVVGTIVTYRQADSRRRSYTGLGNFPACLVSVGDAVASFNPVYGQGMSSAALHASCLSAYLMGIPGLTAAASQFFGLQQVVVDAVWALSAGSDSARLDAMSGAEVPEDVRRQRWATEQLMRASQVDADIAEAFREVSWMLRHPATLAAPAMLQRAIAANEGSPELELSPVH